MIPILCWSVSWYFIKLQLITDSPDPFFSVGYRFIFGGIVLFIITLFVTKTTKLKELKMIEHIYIFSLGLTLFSVNYWLFYVSELYITSAITAVTFSTATFMIMTNERVFLKIPLNREVFWGGVLSFIGVIMVFYSDLKEDTLNSFTGKNISIEEKVLGLFLATLATYVAASGNVLVKYYQQRSNMDNWTMTSIGMLYGGISISAIGLALGKSYQIDWNPTYILSFLYLAIFASVVAFSTYFVLIKRIGPARASFIFFFTPIGASLTSIITQEQSQVNIELLLGTFIVVTGVYIANRKRIKQTT